MPSILLPPSRFVRALPPVKHAARIALALLLLLVLAPAGAQIPSGYYASAEGKTGTQLRDALNLIVKGHTSLSYNAAKDELWEYVDNRGGYVECVYSGRRSTSLERDTGGMNAEHTWPQSRGAGSTPARSDLHHLFVVDETWNSRRGSYIFTDVQNSTATSPIGAEYNSSEGFEPPDQYKGAIARVILYFHVRYLLPVNDTGPLIGNDSSTADNNMGRLTHLLNWHGQFPPSQFERDRNERIYSIQGNRNPFIDRPEFACLIWGGGACIGADTEPPAPPTGLVATGGTARVDLDWNDNTEGDLLGYHVLRAASAGGPFAKLTTDPVTSSSYADTGLAGSTTFHYRVRAVDLARNESTDSGSVNATTEPGGGGTISGEPWINEVHYDNVTADTGEFIELAGPAGMDLSGYSVVLYNGNGGAPYDTRELSGLSLGSQGGCAGFLVLDFPQDGLQNGAPDGFALVKGGSTVIQFLSYEGTFVASGGPANGMTSIDIGVAETNATPIGQSLQLTGHGAAYADFTWLEPGAQTRAAPNTGQTFACGDTEPPAPPTGLAAVANDGSVVLTWTAPADADLDGFRVFRSTEPDVAGTRVSGVNLVRVLTYTDLDVLNGVEYFYTVRAVDESGNESGPSEPASATPMEVVTAHGFTVQ